MAQVHFVAVVDHRSQPGFVVSGARLRAKGLATVWAPAPRNPLIVGHAGGWGHNLERCSWFFAYPLPLLSLSASLIVGVLFGA